MSTPISETTPMIGESPAFVAMLEHVSRVATLSKPVLIIGEIFPKSLAVLAPQDYSLRIGRPLVFVRRVLGPLARLLEVITGDPKIKPACHTDCAFGRAPVRRAYTAGRCRPR